MKTKVFAILWLTFGSSLFAASFTVNDAFGAGATSCASPACDVIGDKLKFDIQGGSFSTIGSSGDFQIFTNFGTSGTLAPFQGGGGPYNLFVGDLLFTVNGVVKYGVALTSHGESGNAGAATGGSGLTAGTLYAVNSVADGVETSDQVMGAPSGSIFRNGANVWLRDFNGSLTALAAGTVSVSPFGDGTTNAHLDIDLQFLNNLPQAFLQDFNGSAFGISFAAATCGNDIMMGNNTAADIATPEPMTMSLMGAGLIGIGLLGRRRRVK